MFFEKDKAHIIAGDEAAATLTYTTDASKTPHEIDLESGPKKVLAIFAIDGDTLKICGAEGSDSRPTKFETPEGSRVALMTLKRSADVKKPAADRVGAAQNRMVSQNYLKQVGIAMHNYHAAFGKLPAAAITDKDGKPLLSWRVAILPFIEQDQLYKEFHLDEPWDSEHNKKLLARMPKVYGATGDKTHIRVFVGKGAGFEGKTGLKLPDFTDGTSNTVLAVEGADAVEWTKPEDYEYSADKKLPKLAGLYEKGFNVLMADGSVRFMSDKTPEATIRAVITRNGGEVIKD